MPGRAARRRAPALRPLHLRLDREAEGRPAHHRRLPARRHLHPPLRLRPEAGVRRLLVRAPTSAGSPATPTSSTARSRTAPPASCTRAPRTIRTRTSGGRSSRATRRHDPLHGADRDPRLHEVGRRVPGQARPLVAAPARHGRRADQPQGVALVLRGDRRRALPDRRHLVADGDRPHPDQPAAGRDRRQAGIRDQAAARRRRGGPRRGGQGGRRRAGIPGPAPALAGDAPHPLQGGGALQGDLLPQVGRDDLLRRRRRAQGRGRLLLGPRPGRRRGQRLRSPPLDRRGRVGDRLLSEGGGVRGDRHQPTRTPARRSAPSSPSRATSRDRTRSSKEIRDHVADRISKIARPEADHLGRRPAQDALRQDHAPPAPRHRRGPRARRRHHAARPGGDGPAGGEDQGDPGEES